MSENGERKPPGEVIPFERGREIGRARQERLNQTQVLLEKLQEKSAHVQNVRSLSQHFLTEKPTKTEIDHAEMRVATLIAQGKKILAGGDVDEHTLARFRENSETFLLDKTV